MQTTMMDGKTVANRILESLGRDAAVFMRETGRKPGLAVIHAGSDPASSVYVRNKEKACLDAGFDCRIIDLPSSISFDTILGEIDKKNDDETCDGLIVQLPLPSSAMDESVVIRRISVEKDVDGFHPESVGNLWSGAGVIAPCTPTGVIELLKAYELSVKGKNVVVIGRSNIVGKPIAALLLAEHATVTIAHSRTIDLASTCKQADMLVAAVGKPGLIDKNYIKPGAIIIDVGINRITSEKARPQWLDPATEIGRKLSRKGFALVGDVDPLSVTGLASFYTPVPGGVGPMTVAMLLKNTLTLACQRKRLSIS